MDLRITLKPPPPGAAPKVIATIDLLCGAPLQMTYTGDLLIQPLTRKEHEDLRWYLEEYWKWPYLEFAERGKEVEQLLTDFGQRLHQALFGSPGATAILHAWQQHPASQHQISIISYVPKATRLPWELLHDEQGFLALRAAHPISIVRCLPQSEQLPRATSFVPPLRVLLITARPEGTGFVDPRAVAYELLDEIQDQMEAGAITLEFLRPPTLEELIRRLQDQRHPIHVLHFDGHGIFEKEGKKQQGKLAFEDKEGKLYRVTGSKLGEELRGRGVRLVVLTACQSALSASDDAFSSVAGQLIHSEIDAVIAMSASVLVASATRYAKAFYRALTTGTMVPLAHQQALHALYADPQRHFLRRHQEEESKPVELRDWWLPHFYQQRPLILQLSRAASPPIQDSSFPRLSESMPPPPRYGFYGRARELHRLEHHLRQKKLVVLHGFGGIGKTAFAREAADWLTRTKMYHGACFISFEGGGDAIWLLSTLGQYLGIYDSQYHPNDITATLAQLKASLQKRRILVIADRMETILSSGETPLEASAQAQFWGVLLALTEMGAGVLLTSRAPAFGDKRLDSGNQRVRLSLGGLSSQEAYELACSVLDRLKIDRQNVPLVELHELLVQLDHHPLAIQLVLPVLQYLPLAKVRADFVTLLPQFLDDSRAGLNRSLLSSLEYSIQRLSATQRSLLPRLALFEGGANKNELLAITEIPPDEWEKLCLALEQTGLLRVERLEALLPPFLWFHPILAPYLRNQLDVNEVALYERYTHRYYELTTKLLVHERKNPFGIALLVQRELPNLKHTLELLLKAGNTDMAAEMARTILDFLYRFGLRREYTEWYRVATLNTQTRRAVIQGNVTVGAISAPISSDLTQKEFRQEISIGMDEYRKGNFQGAYNSFIALLERVEARSKHKPLGRDSYEHCEILHHLAQSLTAGGFPVAAQGQLQKALTICEGLTRQLPANESLIALRGHLLLTLGDALGEQGQYQKAQQAYEEGLRLTDQVNDFRSSIEGLQRLARLARERADYDTARSYCRAALNVAGSLREPVMESAIWYILGQVALDEKDWTEAEQCYARCLELDEGRGDIAHVASDCHQLAMAVEGAGRPTEAENWYKRGLKLIEQVEPGGHRHAEILNNLAYLLLLEAQATPSPLQRLKEALGYRKQARLERLGEARGYAEQALTIKETLDPSSSAIWPPLGILATIAHLEGREEEARTFRRREQEAYAAFEGNRYHIDRLHGRFIVDIAAAARGNFAAWIAVRTALPLLQKNGWPMVPAIERILDGERNWPLLAENLDGKSALFIKRVLEIIENPHDPLTTTRPETTVRRIMFPSLSEAFEHGDLVHLPALIRDALQPDDLEALPADFREAVEHGNSGALKQAFRSLPPEKRRAVEAAVAESLWRERRDGRMIGMPRDDDSLWE